MMRNPTLATTDASASPAQQLHLPDLPRLVPMPAAQRTFGLSRATFLETETVLAWLARLPAITPKTAV